MLSTLFLTFACAAPAQEPSALLVDLLPADSLVVVEASLEPWDRLRKQTRAHALLRGQDILKTTLSIVTELGADQNGTDLRSALGSVRFLVAVTPTSLEYGGVLLVVEPVGLGSAGFEWADLMQEVRGVTPVRFGSGFLTLVSEDPSDAEAIDAHLAGLVEKSQARESTLGSQTQWTSLHREISSQDDLLRVTVPGWNWKSDSLTALMSANDPDSSELVAGFFDEFSKFVGLQHGMAWTTSIQGAEVIDSLLLPRDPDETSYWASLGPADKALDRIGKMQGGLVTATAYALDLPAWFGGVESLMRKTMELEGQSIDEDPVLVALMDSMRGTMANLGPNIFAWQSLEDSANGGLGSYQIQVRDRAALESSWAKMPQEVSSILPLILMPLGAGPDAVELTDTMLNIRLGSVQADGEPVATSNEFKQMRSELLAYLNGVEPLMIQTMPMEMDRLWLTEGGGLFEAMEMFFGVEFGGEIKPEQLKSLRPIWMAGKRTERGIEFQARSTFGITVSSGLAGIMQMLLLGESDSSDDLDEEEF